MDRRMIELQNKVERLDVTLFKVKVLLGVSVFTIVLIAGILGFTIAEHMQDVQMLKNLIYNK